MRYVVRPARRGIFKRAQWRPYVLAANNKKLLWGETYNNIADAVDALVNACGVRRGDVEIEGGG